MIAMKSFFEKVFYFILNIFFLNPILFGLFLSNIGGGGGTTPHEFALRAEIGESDTCP